MIESLVRMLAEGHLNTSEMNFLIRRLNFASETEAWSVLRDLYGQPPEVLKMVERRVLMRASPEGTARVRAMLQAPPQDLDLTPSQHADLVVLVELAALLHAKASVTGEAKPDAAPLLAEDVRSGGDNKAGQRTPSHPYDPPSPLPSALSDQAAEQALPLVNHLTLPAALKKMPPHALLELFWTTWHWLNDTARRGVDLVGFLRRETPIEHDEVWAVCRLTYSVGLIDQPNLNIADRALLTSSLHNAADVASFRLACADAFARRVRQNDYLLRVLDRLGSAEVSRIMKLALNGAVDAEVEARLGVWEALGMVEPVRRRVWAITPAGRAVVAGLPPSRVVVEEHAAPMPVVVDDEWLNVL